MRDKAFVSKSATQTATALDRWLPSTAVALGMITALTGAGHLWAWLSGYLAQRVLGTIIMKTNLALCLVLSGVALVLIVMGRDTSARSRAARACAVIVLVLGALTLAENAFNWDFGIDQILAKEPPGALGVASPNRMGTPASAGLVLSALSLMILSRRDRRGVRAAQWMAVGVSLIALLGTVGFLYGVQGLYAIVRVTAIAWPSAVGLLALGLGLLFARPSEGLMAIFAADDAGGRIARWMLLPSVGLPLVIGYFRLLFERRGIFDAAMGTALVMLLFIVAFTFLTYQSGLRLSRWQALERASQEALRRSEDEWRVADAGYAERQRFFCVLDTLPTMICLLTPDHRVVFANRSFRERFGESNGRHCYECCFSRTEPCEFCESFKVLETNKPHHWEVTTPDGDAIDIYDYPFTDGDGSPLILKMASDITVRKRAEAALREAGAYDRSLIEASIDPFVTIGSNGRITDVNAATERATGLGRLELVGTDFSDYFTDPERARAGYQQVFREGTVQDYPLEIRHRDGRTMPVLYNAAVYRAGDGVVAGVFAAARDITERRRAEAALNEANETLERRVAARTEALREEITERRRTEEALRESELRFRLALRNAPVSVAAQDRDLRYIWAYNQGTASPEEIIGKLDAEIFAPEEAAHLTAIKRRVLDDDVELREQMWLDRPGGRKFLDVCFEPLRDEAGRVVGVGTATVDLTPIKIAETTQQALVEERGQLLESERSARGEAERANRLKDEFLANLSHELRTPLNAILGWAQILRRGHVDAEGIWKGLEVIERNSRIQVQLVSDLLDMSRILSGKMRLETRNCDPAWALGAAIDSVAPAAEAKRIRIDKLIEPLPGSVLGDPDRLQQAFWNLLSNAIKFTPSEGRVQIVMRRTDSRIEIVFRDSGKGISPDILPYIFERFRQADSSTTKNHAGLGLGLSIAKHLVELHGGTVKAESPGEGRGATLTVTLPIIAIRREGDELDGGQMSVDDLGLGKITLNGLRVLFVDDEPDTRQMIKRLLEDRGAGVAVADCAATGVALLQEFRPDVLIGDIGMPGEDGFEMIRRIRNLPPECGGQTPAIALTAHSRVEDRARALIAGYQYHLAKPVEAVELIATLEMISQRGPKTQAASESSQRTSTVSISVV